MSRNASSLPQADHPGWLPDERTTRWTHLPEAEASVAQFHSPALHLAPLLSLLRLLHSRQSFGQRLHRPKSNLRARRLAGVLERCTRSRVAYFLSFLDGRAEANFNRAQSRHTKAIALSDLLLPHVCKRF